MGALLNINAVDTPALVVDLARLESNISSTAQWLREKGINWRPHVKGHKTPAIAQLQLAAGAIGVTCATLREAEVMAAAGVKQILIANQLVGARSINRLIQLCCQADIIIAIDDADNACNLAAAASQRQVSLGAVVEVDIGMGRCGVLPGYEVLRLAQTIAKLPGLRWCGVMGWEGHVRRIPDLGERATACHQAVQQLVMSAELCREAGLPVPIVSCGGTGTHWFSAEESGVTELQAGGLIFNDRYYSSLGLTHPPALYVVSTVISRPNPLRIVTDAGRKAMSTETALPAPVGIPAVEQLRFSAEHSTIVLTEECSRPQVGDLLFWEVGYGDTTVCLHDQMVGLRNQAVEVIWPIAARSRLG